jgi:hypothetical protein
MDGRMMDGVSGNSITNEILNEGKWRPRSNNGLGRSPRTALFHGDDYSYNTLFF